MAFQLFDVSGNVQNFPQWIDPVYKASGVITAAQAAGSAKDCFLFTASATGLTRIVGVDYTLIGGGTVSAAANYMQLLRVTAAPTGQTNVAVTPARHALTDPATTATCAITPNTSQTAGTSAVVLATGPLTIDSTTNFGSVPFVMPVGPSVLQEPIVVPQGGFITLRGNVLIPASSLISFNFYWTEAAF